MELRNLKGTEDFLSKEQKLRNKIKVCGKYEIKIIKR